MFVILRWKTTNSIFGPLTIVEHDRSKEFALQGIAEVVKMSAWQGLDQRSDLDITKQSNLGGRGTDCTATEAPQLESWANLNPEAVTRKIGEPLPPPPPNRNGTQTRSLSPTRFKQLSTRCLTWQAICSYDNARSCLGPRYPLPSLEH
jgi:hypothetical protein